MEQSAFRVPTFLTALRSSAFVRRLLLSSVVLAIAVAMLGVAQPVRAAGNTYYVAKNGSNSNPGTEGQPWLTIQRAANTVGPGDTVYVRGGVYSEYVYIGTSGSYTGKSGTSGSPITYRAYPGESPIIDGTGLGNPGWRGLVTVYNLAYINISGFEIRNTPQKGVLIFGRSSYVTLSNLKIHGMTMGGVYAETTTNLLIDSCEVYDTNTVIESDEQVSLITCSNFEIRNSSFHNSGKNALDFKEGSSNGLIHHNEIYGTNDTTTGIYLDANGKAQDNFKIYANKIHDCTGPGIVLGSETSPYPAITNVDIFNNLIYNNNTGFAVWANPFTRNFRIINNTFYGNNAAIGVYGTGWAAGVNSNCIIRNNIIMTAGGYLIGYEGYATGGSITIDRNLYYDTAGAYRREPSSMLGSNYIQANPQLISAGSNFSLTSGSPAKDAGSSVSAPSTDYAGAARPQGAGHDIGGYEYSQNPVPPPAAPAPTPTPTPAPAPVPAPAPAPAPGGSTVYESNLASADVDNIGANLLKAQSFTPSVGHTVTSVSLKLTKTGNPSGYVTVRIRATDGNGLPTGSDLAVGQIAASAITSIGWYDFSLGAGVWLSAGTRYAICMQAPGSDLGSNTVWYYIATTNPYAAGWVTQSYSSGASWSDVVSRTYDAAFKELGAGAAPPAPTPAPAPAPAPVPAPAPAPAPGGSTVYESNLASADVDNIGANLLKAQSFTPSVGHTVTGVSLKLTKTGNPTGYVTVRIRATDGNGLPTGSDLAVGQIAASAITSIGWYDFSLGAGVWLSAGSRYAICMQAPGSDLGSNTVWYYIATTNPYAKGWVTQSYSSGASWSDVVSRTYDAAFKELGW